MNIGKTYGTFSVCNFSAIMRNMTSLRYLNMFGMKLAVFPFSASFIQRVSSMKGEQRFDPEWCSDMSWKVTPLSRQVVKECTTLFSYARDVKWTKWLPSGFPRAASWKKHQQQGRKEMHSNGSLNEWAKSASRLSDMFFCRIFQWLLPWVWSTTSLLLCLIYLPWRHYIRVFHWKYMSLHSCFPWQSQHFAHLT